MKTYAKILLVGGVGSYSYLYYRCKKLREESMDFDMIQVKKDNTRPSNVFYGINWGYRSDETIEKSLDTGDLIFFNYECSNCFSPEEVAICYKQKYFGSLREDEAQNMAFCLRTP